MKKHFTPFTVLLALWVAFGGEVPPSVLAAPGTEPERFGVTGLPESYLVDASGQLRLRFSGPRDWRSAAMQETVISLPAGE